MTTPEHTLVGIHSAFAAGLHRRLGWRSVAMAGLASNVPDWDGIPMFVDMARFEEIHRVWGHSVLSILLTAVILAATQVRWDWIGRIGRWFVVRFPMGESATPAVVEAPDVRVGFLALLSIACIVQVLHLPCDMVVSGGNGLSNWSVQPWWPFSRAAYVYPMIPWGDPGPTLILMAGAVCVAKWRSRAAIISKFALAALVAYLIVRRVTTVS